MKKKYDKYDIAPYRVQSRGDVDFACTRYDRDDSLGRIVGCSSGG